MTDRYIDSHNLENLKVVKMKKNYTIFEEIGGYNKPIVFKLSGMKCPFGIEKYFFKEIINFEFLNKDGNNNMLNNYSKIKQLDEFFRDRDEFNGKQYMSCLRPRDDYDPLIRIHVKQKKNILTKVTNKNNQIDTLFNVKNKLCTIDVEIINLWTTDINYGLTLGLNAVHYLT